MKFIERLEGDEATERYGVCPCVNATLQNQVWIVYRDVRRLGAAQAIYVTCGLCGRRFDWWK